MISTWVLIMTLTTNDAVSIESVSGFASAKSCSVAGDLWLKQKTTYNFFHKSTICVKQ